MVGLMSPIGQNLRRLREAAGLTQQGLAVAAGMNASIVAQLEQGRNKNPRAATLRSLARALKTTIDELMRDPDEPAEADQGDDEPPALGRGKGKK